MKHFNSRALLVCWLLIGVVGASNAASPGFLFKFGTSGSGDREFDQLRAVEVDSAYGHIIVADRDNSRIQVVDSTGHYKITPRSRRQIH